MRTSTTLLAFLAAAAAAGCVIIAEDDSSLTIDNDSTHLITEVHIAPVGDRSWGPNLLASPLHPGESLTVDRLDCGWYDVLVSNERNIDCIVSDWHLCFEDDVWHITNGTLDACAWD
ncbi:MAG: hypothetical protein JNL83_25935 [Myxococcales bacterium]|nr:hypothetical protein [Myxococcales bacterium]